MDLKTPHPLQTPQRATDLRMADGFGAFLLAVPVLVYGWVFSRYAIGIPKFDDHALRAFLAELHGADTLHEKIYHFFKQHNEHRIVLDRFVAWLDYTLTGKLQYMHLMILGNLSLVALLFVFVKALRRASLPVWMALPVSLLLFNLSQWENMFWGMAALQNFTVVALAIATFYQLSFGKAVNGWAIGLAVLATLTSGNGLLIWPVGLVLLLLRQDFSGTLRWLVALTITIRLYFLGYKKVTSNPPDQGSVMDLFQGWFLFNGSAAQALPVSNYLFICLAAGLVLTGVTVVLALVQVFRRFRGQTLAPWSLFFLGSAGFLVGTGLVVAFGRMGFGLETLLTSRYKIYSLTLLALLFSYALVQTRTLSDGRKSTVPIASAAILVSFLITLLSYSRYLDETVYLRHYLTTNQFNWTYTTNRPVSTIDAGTRELMDNEPAFYDTHLPQFFQPLPATSVVPLDTLFYANGEHVARLDSFPVLGLRDEGAYLIVRSARRTYLFPTRQTMASGRRAWLQPGQAFASGFTAQFLDAELAKDTYDVGLLAVGADGTFRIHPTGRQIRSLGQAPPTVRKNW